MKWDEALPLLLYALGGSIGLAILSIDIYRRLCPPLASKRWQWQRYLGWGLVWLLFILGNLIAHG